MGNIVVVDIDGTLSKVGSRLECLKSDPPDWDTFYARCGEDEPVIPIVILVKLLEKQYHIVLCSGRRESCKKATQKWLEQCGIFYTDLLLRKDNDFRHDSIIKPELLAKAGIKISDIAFVLEDRNSMVAEWRRLGLTCLQVAEGDF